MADPASPSDPFASPSSSRPSSLRPRTATSTAPSEISTSTNSPIPRSILNLPSAPPRFSSASSVNFSSILSNNNASPHHSTINPARHSTLPPKKLPRMQSHMLPEGYSVPKPWKSNPSARESISYYIVYLLILVGAVLGSIQTYYQYRNVQLDRKDLCLVLEENFDDPEKVFGDKGTFFREVNMDGFGNGEFAMSTASTNNSFVKDGKLYIVPTLTSDSIGESAVFDGTVYNITGCTFNTTRPDNGYVTRGGVRYFDQESYLRSCSMVSNETAGTIINPVQSARVTTRYSASIRYGRVEIKAKMPEGDWMWPALWMLPRDEVYGAWPRSGEIDIVESRGNGIRYTARGANYVQGALNWGPAPSLNGVEKTYSWWTEKRKRFSDDFHTYVLEWTQEFIRIYVDTRLHTLLDLRFRKPFFQLGQFPSTFFNGTSLVPLTNPWSNATHELSAPFDQEFYLIMNVAVGGTSGWFPEGQGNKPWLDRAQNPMRDFAKAKGRWYGSWPETAERRGLVVDYVKMWKHCDGS